MSRVIRLVLVVAGMTVAAGCSTTAATAMATNSNLVKEQLAVVSAGHTGCMPEQNDIAIIWAKFDGSGVWTATCKGQTYLCSTIRSTGSSSSYSCALQVK